MMMLPRQILSPILLCVALQANVSRAQTPPNPNQRTVEVTGHGDANAKPDALIVSFAVDNQAPTADECTREHAEKVRKVIDALKDKLGSDTKIETTDYSLNPNVTYVNAPELSQPEQPRSLWDFKASLTATGESLEMMGDLIESAMAAGAKLQQSGIGQLPDNQDTGETPPASALLSRRSYPQRMKQGAFVMLDVEVQGSSPGDATRKGSARVAQLEKVLKQQLGEKGTVTLSEFSIAQHDPSRIAAPPPPQPQQVQNFAAHTTITAETSKLDLLGAVVQAGLDSGASRLNQVQFTLHEDAQARKDAIEKASAEAKTKAESVATSMGVKLGKILRISTNAQVRPQVIYGNSFQTGRFMARAQSAAASSVPVLPREVGFSADVTVVYEIE